MWFSKQMSRGGRGYQRNMAGVLSIIERRINRLGVSEPVVQRQGNRRIIIQLPGIHDQQQAIDTVGKTALLEFKDPYGGVTA